jgi:hypothetical protein
MGRGANQLVSEATSAVRQLSVSDARIDVAAALPSREVALLVLTGSRAYGTSHAGSDYDYRGVYVDPSEQEFDLRPPQQTIA